MGSYFLFSQHPPDAAPEPRSPLYQSRAQQQVDPLSQELHSSPRIRGQNASQVSDNRKEIFAKKRQQHRSTKGGNGRDEMDWAGKDELVELKRKFETDHRSLTRAERHKIIMAKKSGNWKHPPKVDKNEVIITKPPKVPSRAHLHRRAANNPSKSSNLPALGRPPRTDFSNPDGGHLNDQSSGIPPPNTIPYIVYPSPYTQSTHLPSSTPNAPTLGLIPAPRCLYCNCDITEIEHVTGGRFPNACPSCGYPRSYLPAAQQQSIAAGSLPLIPNSQEASPIGYVPAPPAAQTSHHSAQQATLAGISPLTAPRAMREQIAAKPIPGRQWKTTKQRLDELDIDLSGLKPKLAADPTTSKQAAPKAMREQIASKTVPSCQRKNSKQQRRNRLDFPLSDMGPILADTSTTSKRSAPGAMREQNARKTVPGLQRKNSKKQRRNKLANLLSDMGPILPAAPTMSKRVKQNPTKRAGQLPVEENERINTAWEGPRDQDGFIKQEGSGEVTPQMMADSLSSRTSQAKSDWGAGEEEYERVRAAWEGARNHYDGDGESVVKEEEEDPTNRDDDVLIEEEGARNEMEEYWEEEEIRINSEDEV